MVLSTILRKISFSNLSYIHDLCIWNEEDEINESGKINLILIGTDINEEKFRIQRSNSFIWIFWNRMFCY